MAKTGAIKVALLGAGIVGGGVARILAEKKEIYARQLGRPVELTGALVHDLSKPRPFDAGLLTTDADQLIGNPEVDIVVEVIGGTEPARDLHLAAFERGKHVVTANKELVAKEWRQLHETARLAKRELRFEAAVAAAVPVIAAARALGAVRPRVLSGLLNGTTTYICSRMEQGADFGAALAEAQGKGYAEADPSADVDGWDPAYKLSILVSLLDGRWFDPAMVRRASLRSVTPQQISDAAARGNRVRYLAVADFGERATKARVGVEEVPASSLEGQATGPTNVVRLDTDLTGPLTFVGAGAGGEATASAILGDVIQIARAMR